MSRNSQLTDDIHRRVVEAIRAGQKSSIAAAYAGIRSELLSTWLSRGEAYDEHLSAGGEPIDGEHRYWLLNEDVRRAQAEVAVSAAGELRVAWQNHDWRAALAWLERSHPQDWVKPQKVEMSGNEGGPIRVADVTETERRLADSLRAAIAANPTAELAPPVEDAEIVDVNSRTSRPTEKNPWAQSDAEGDEYDPYGPWSASIGLGDE